MDLRHPRTKDPVGRAVDLALLTVPSGVGAATRFGADEFWTVMKRDGFYLVDEDGEKVTNPVEDREWGAFAAVVALNHAVALGRVECRTYGGAHGSDYRLNLRL